MNNADRVIINTTAQYIRTVINLCLSFYSTRIILEALGVDDYGIYTLVAGIIAMLSFVVNALVITTQRYMSFYNGRKDDDKQKEIICSSLFIHFVLGIVAAIIIEIIGLFLFDGFLNIEINRLSAAKIVYHCVIAMLLISFITAPFRALLISHENIVYISVIDILDGILKLLIAIFVASSNLDRLVLYAILLCLISLFNFISFSGYDYLKYSECIIPRVKYINKTYVREISSFAGWTIYSVGCITGRTQGMSIVLNKFFSVAVNAAYGIAIQVNGAIAFLSNSVMNAMNPQIVKAEGRGERQKMLRLAEMESKFCFLLLGMIVIPSVIEMPRLLSIWLKEVPDNAVMFCRFILLTRLVDQLTIGLGTANQAIGQIRNYSLAVNTLKVFSLIPIIAALTITKSLLVVMIIYILFEFLCSLVRLVYLKKSAGLLICDFCRRVFLCELLPIAAVIIVTYNIYYLIDFNYRFILMLLSSVIVMMITSYCAGLCEDERIIIKSVLGKIKK